MTAREAVEALALLPSLLARQGLMRHGYFGMAQVEHGLDCLRQILGRLEHLPGGTIRGIRPGHTVEVSSVVGARVFTEVAHPGRWPH